MELGAAKIGGQKWKHGRVQLLFESLFDIIGNFGKQNKKKKKKKGGKPNEPTKCGGKKSGKYRMIGVACRERDIGSAAEGIFFSA